MKDKSRFHNLISFTRRRINFSCKWTLFSVNIFLFSICHLIGHLFYLFGHQSFNVYAKLSHNSVNATRMEYQEINTDDDINKWVSSSI